MSRIRNKKDNENRSGWILLFGRKIVDHMIIFDIKKQNI